MKPRARTRHMPNAGTRFHAGRLHTRRYTDETLPVPVKHCTRAFGFAMGERIARRPHKRRGLILSLFFFNHCHSYMAVHFLEMFLLLVYFVFIIIIIIFMLIFGYSTG